MASRTRTLRKTQEIPSGHDPSELAVDVAQRQHTGVDRVLQFPERGALPEAIDDDEIRPVQTGGRELLFSWGV